MKRWLKLSAPVVLGLTVFVLSGCSILIRRPQEVWRESHREVPRSEFSKTFEPDGLKEEIRFLFKTLEAVHPDPYARVPSPESHYFVRFHFMSAAATHVGFGWR